MTIILAFWFLLPLIQGNGKHDEPTVLNVEERRFYHPFIKQIPIYQDYFDSLVNVYTNGLPQEIMEAYNVKSNGYQDLRSIFNDMMSFPTISLESMENVDRIMKKVKAIHGFLWSLFYIYPESEEELSRREEVKGEERKEGEESKEGEEIDHSELPEFLKEIKAYNGVMETEEGELTMEKLGDNEYILNLAEDIKQIAIPKLCRTLFGSEFNHIVTEICEQYGTQQGKEEAYVENPVVNAHAKDQYLESPVVVDHVEEQVLNAADPVIVDKEEIPRVVPELNIENSMDINRESIENQGINDEDLVDATAPAAMESKENKQAIINVRTRREEETVLDAEEEPKKLESNNLHKKESSKGTNTFVAAKQRTAVAMKTSPPRHSEIPDCVDKECIKPSSFKGSVPSPEEEKTSPKAVEHLEVLLEKIASKIAAKVLQSLTSTAQIIWKHARVDISQWLTRLIQFVFNRTEEKKIVKPTKSPPRRRSSKQRFQHQQRFVQPRRLSVHYNTATKYNSNAGIQFADWMNESFESIHMSDSLMSLDTTDEFLHVSSHFMILYSLHSILHMDKIFDNPITNEQKKMLTLLSTQLQAQSSSLDIPTYWKIVAGRHVA